MNMKNCVAISFLIIFLFFSPAFAAIKRPPQFVVISFDNGGQISHFKQLADFLDKMNHQHQSIHFTFFISGTSFLTKANKYRYQGPNHVAGEAEIPFGGSQENLEARIMLMNKLYLKGNEFASHAVGHFDGATWTIADWEKEFNSYHKLFDDIVLNNGLAVSPRLVFSFKKVVGFRAPYLAVNSDLFRVLQSNHYRYDASGIGNPDAWPSKIGGLWHFNLANLKIAGTNKDTISMDYNFYLAQSEAKEDPNPEHQRLYRTQMLATYMNYFLSNYHGNRAPIHIGHHFTNFQQGVYNQALLEFSQHVCRLPEVRCVSFKELADFMDRLSLNDLKAYQKNAFHRLG